MKNRYLFLTVLGLFFIFCQPPPSYFQGRGPGDQRMGEGFSPVGFRAYPLFFDDTRYQVLLIAEVVYDAMQFTLNENLYQSDIAVEVIFREENNRATHTRLWQSSLTLPRFEDTNQRYKYFRTADSISLPPGSYQVSFKYQDLQGKQEIRFSRNYRFPLPSKLFAHAPLILNLDEPASEIGLIPHQPTVYTERLPFNRNLGFLLNIYTPGDPPLQIQMDITSQTESLSIFQLDTAATAGERNTRVLVNPRSLEWQEGKYLLNVFYRTAADSIRQSISFEVIWPAKPRSLRQIEYAVQPLKIILPEDQYREMTSGSTATKAARFREFWKQKDPTAGTAYNEILHEFYLRVDSMDYVYGDKSRQYGWNTDPGRIILIYGVPDVVEDRSLNPVDPYLRWIYYFPEGERSFTFEALQGRKRYRLINDQKAPSQ